MDALPPNPTTALATLSPAAAYLARKAAGPARPAERPDTGSSLLRGFLKGLFLPWWALLAQQLYVLYEEHGPEIERAVRDAPALFDDLRALRARDPVLFDQLVKDLLHEAWQRLPDGVRPEEVAFLAGRLVRAYQHTADPAHLPAALLEVCLLWAGLHVPQMMVRGLAAALDQQLAKLSKDPQAVLLLARIERRAQDLVPVLSTLAGAGFRGVPPAQVIDRLTAAGRIASAAAVAGVDVSPEERRALADRIGQASGPSLSDIAIADRGSL